MFSVSKRNSKKPNVSSVVLVRCTALKMDVFSSSRSRLCNEWPFMSVRPAEAELRWFKRNRESHGTGHTAGDHVLVKAFLAANFIVVLVYLLVLGQLFRFRRLQRAGTPSAATSASWVHGPSKTRLLLGFLSTIRYNAGSNNTVADSAATWSTSARNSETLAIIFMTGRAGPRRSTRLIVSTLREKI